ncbi:MAG: hypothetical protein RL722_1411 [Pseudomonadota bacterium]
MASLVTLATLAGCSATPGKVDGACDIPVEKILSRIDTRAMVDELAADLCNVSSGEPPSFYRATLPLLVPDAVEVHSYQPNEFGMSLSELFRESINKRCLSPVKQVEMARNFNLNQNGLVALSRNNAELRETSVALPTALVATYDIAPDKLTVIARAIRIEDSVITRISSREVSWRCSATFSGAAEIKYQMK